MRAPLKKQVLFVVGVIALGLGFIGVFLPVMPTVPFMIVAAYCFSRSSKRLHTWLLTRPQFGPALRDWEESRVIRRRSKIIATIALVTSVSATAIFVSVAWWAKAAMITTAVLVLAYIWAQKSEAS